MMKGTISKSTAALLSVIALLVGALVVTVTTTHRIPVFLDTAHAATAEPQLPFYSFAPIVKRTMPAVVNISSSKVVKDQPQGGGIFDDPFFRQFFGGRTPQQQQPRSERETSLGSGVVVSPDGYIITNNHVVDGATDVKVSFANKEEFPAKVIGTDKYTDIAVLKINKSGLTTLPFADSSRAQVGDVVLAIGEPFGLGQTVTMGIISAKGRAGLGIERFEDFIQTDAAINRGNSGGALIDTHGDLVGINTAILSGETGGNQGIGFAIPANLAKNIMDQILKSGKVTRGFLGITPQELTPDMAKAFNMPNGHGVAISTVVAGSPAAKAGLKVGDVITGVNGNPVEDVNSFRLEIAGFAPGTTVHLKVERNGQALDIPVTLSVFNLEAENNGEGQGNVPNGGEKGALHGVSVQALTPDIRQQLQLPESTHGVVITDVDPDSAAAGAGLSQGDIILQVNRKPVNSVAEFNAAVNAGSSNGSTLLLVQSSRGGTGFVVVPNK
ncbi:MAG TPA: DegQ family serine endoprotease [Bryobacteraceae bacterium]|nr:DegQ family serine endoprotease [Bryobacteraceae bacterium]